MKARAALIEAPNTPFELVDDLEVEDPRAGEVLVRVTHCGVCHSDLHVADGSIGFPMPVVVGHEVAGIVAAVGAGVLHLREGDHVVLTCRPPCGECYWCVRGEEFLCERSMAWATGTLQDGSTRLSHRGRTVYRGIGIGGFAEFVVSDARGAIKVPDETPPHIAAVLGCAVQTGLGAAMHSTSIQTGDTVLIVGLGGVGVCIAQGARIAGASKIIGVDRSESRRAQASRFGVHEALDPGSTDVVSAVLELTGGVGVDHALDTVAAIETTQSCLTATRPGGTVVIVGVAGEHDEIRIPSRVYVGENKRLVGSFMGSANPHTAFPLYLSLWNEGRLDLEGLVTAVRPLAEVNEAFDNLKATTGLRTVLELSADGAG
jgi:S-(hydroxymethyl)glutathione dehydrogenase / alcohol dehydrogenase